MNNNNYYKVFKISSLVALRIILFSIIVFFVIKNIDSIIEAFSKISVRDPIISSPQIINNSNNIDLLLFSIIISSGISLLFYTYKIKRYYKERVRMGDIALVPLSYYIHQLVPFLPYLVSNKSISENRVFIKANVSIIIIDICFILSIYIYLGW